jgi:molybdopterin-guanine dinucleotide biosynthesis protein A
VAGRPLLEYPAAALAATCDAVVVVCKPDTELPPLAGLERWDEPAEPRHPLVGIVHALETAVAPVLVCAADMPFVTPDACRTLVQAAGVPPAVVAVADGVVQPTFGLYAPAALDGLRAAAPDAPLTRTVEGLDPVHVAFPAALVRSLNTPEDLKDAERLLAGR